MKLKSRSVEIKANWEKSTVSSALTSTRP